MDWSFVQSFPAGDPKYGCDKAPNSVFLFNYNFKMNDPGSNHIHATIRADQLGKIGGEFTYDNDSMWGFCGGIVVGLYDSAGQQLKFFTPPSGCIDGKPPGGAIQRPVPWNDSFDSGLFSRISRLEVRAYHSSKPGNLPTPEQVLGFIKTTVEVISAIE
jgi:hypothetical protein